MAEPTEPTLAEAIEWGEEASKELTPTWNQEKFDRLVEGCGELVEAHDSWSNCH